MEAEWLDALISAEGREGAKNRGRETTNYKCGIIL